MTSLFDLETNRELSERLLKLKPDAQALWGKMTVSQMLKHAQGPFKVAFEEITFNRGLVGILFGGIARKKLSGPEPFSKNLPTAKVFIVKDNPDFEIEKAKLLNYIKQFSIRGPAGITLKPHPFFGAMNSTEWDMLMYKHLDHHLRQFGA